MTTPYHRDQNTETRISAAHLWPLFVGVFFFVAAGSLQNTLVSLSITAHAHDSSLTGLIMALYFAGFFIGAAVARRLIAVLGHVACFGLMAGLSAMALSFFPMADGPALWALLQVITGFAIACLYVVIESWFNIAAEPRFRARLFGLYMVFWFIGAGVGPLLLNLPFLDSAMPYFFIALLFLLAGAAVAMARRAAPTGVLATPLPLVPLYRKCPTGVVATFLVGLSFGAVLGMTAAYGADSGLSDTEITIFVSAFIFGGALTQYPTGILADHFGRKNILVCYSGLASIAALQIAFADGFIGHLVGAVSFGGFALPIYALAVADAQNELAERHRISASASLLILNGQGSFFGPMLLGLAAGHFGPSAQFIVLAGVHLALVFYCLIWAKQDTLINATAL